MRLLGVEVRTVSGEVTAEITASGELSYTTLRLNRPHRFVVDLAEVVAGAVPASIEVRQGPVERIRVGQFQLSPRPICRLVFDLESAVEPEIEAGGRRLTVRFAPVGRPPAEPRPVPRATVLRGLDLRSQGSTAVLRVVGDGWIPFSSYRLLDPDRLVVEVQGLRSDHPPGPIPSHRGPVTGVQVVLLAGAEGLAGAGGPAVRLLLGLVPAADHRVESTPDGLVVTVTSPVAEAPAPVAAAPASTPPATEPAASFDHHPLLEAALPSYPSLHITGFSEVNYSDSDAAARPQGFSEGQLVLHLSSALSSRISFFGELAVTARDDEFEVSMERGLLRYDHSDRLKVSLGRYHTPVSWWNTAYHHGAWLHTTIGRPEMLAFGGRFLPLHFVGGVAEGTFPAGGLNLGYRAGLGNGRAEDPRRPGDAGDANSSLAWLVHLGVRPERPFGLEAGGAFYLDRLSPAGGPEVDERIASAYVVWQRYEGELIAELAQVQHLPDAATDAFTSRAYYLQAAYRLPWAGERLKPYYRYESIDLAAGDPVFAGVPELEGSTFGLRLDFTQFAALKAEYRLFRRPGRQEEHGGFAQVAFTF